MACHLQYLFFISRRKLCEQTKIQKKQCPNPEKIRRQVENLLLKEEPPPDALAKKKRHEAAWLNRVKYLLANNFMKVKEVLR